MTSKALTFAKLLGPDNTINSSSLSAEIVLGPEKYSTPDGLPGSANIGDQAFVQSTNRLYIWNGSGWYSVALINTSPSFDSGGTPDPSYTLDSNGGIPITIQLSATDPEDVPIQWSYIASDSAQYFADIVQDSSVFTITAKPTNVIEQYDSAGGTFSITFRASDGVNLATALSEFTIKFGIDWSSSTFHEFTDVDLIDNTDGYFGGGSSISPDGTLALFGTDGDRFSFSSLGGLNIFRLSGSNWVPEAALFASPGTSTNSFAGGPTNLFSFNTISCSEDNNTVVVGAPGMTVSSQSGRGGIFIFNYNSGTWSQTTYFTINSFAAAEDRFGHLVRISGDGETILAGIPRWNYSVSFDGGGAFIYRKTNGTWSMETSSTGLPFSTRADNNYSGAAGDISYNGNTAACNNGNNVVVFTRSGSTWTQQASFTSGSGINFGWDISMTYDGNVLAIGARADNTVATQSGAVYIWERSGTTWSQTHKIVPSGLVAYSRYGTGVSISGDGKILAVESGDSLTKTQTGIGREIYIYEKQPDNSWLQVNKIRKDINDSMRAGWNGITIAKKTGGSLILSPTDYGSTDNETVDIHTAG